MTIPIGPLRLIITLSLAEDSRTCWEELSAVEVEDQELARMNRRNTLYPEIVRWDHLIHFIGGTRRS
jgi:hypothetical protein